jgi:protein-disulfide isomerase-like protein with CxxC motif
MVTGKVQLQSYVQSDMQKTGANMDSKYACRSVITLSKKMGLCSFLSMIFSILINASANKHFNKVYGITRP